MSLSLIKYFLLIIGLIFHIQFMDLHAISEANIKRIENLVKENPGQMSINEYIEIAKLINSLTPCNILIYGVGKDSCLWMDLNNKGTTHFLEDNQQWLDIVRNELPNISVSFVKFTTQRSQWKDLLHTANNARLQLKLPRRVLNQKWDVIIVDGPAGYSDKTPGRMQSIYTAAYLAKNKSNTHIFVHDCDRIVEKKYCDKFLKQKNLKSSVDRLNHYIIP